MIKVLFMICYDREGRWIPLKKTFRVLLEDLAQVEQTVLEYATMVEDENCCTVQGRSSSYTSCVDRVGTP
jgi:hypothetical protein